MNRGRDRIHTALPNDPLGTLLQDVSPPVDHPLLLREEIKRNATGEVVEIRMIFKKTPDDPSEVIYSKLITPISGNTVATTTQTIFPWVLV